VQKHIGQQKRLSERKFCSQSCSAARPPSSATHQKLSILTFEPDDKSTLRRFTSAKNKKQQNMSPVCDNKNRLNDMTTMQFSINNWLIHTVPYVINSLLYYLLQNLFTPICIKNMSQRVSGLSICLTSYRSIIPQKI